MYRVMGRVLVFLLLLALVSLLAGCSKSPINRAQAFLDAGMASEAVPLLQLEIQSNPKNARAHLMLGQAQLMLNDQAAAQESFGRALLLNPGWVDKVGRAYVDAASRLSLGDYSEMRLAVSYLESARHTTRSFDKDIAKLMRRIGLRLPEPELLRSAVQVDGTLAKDDSLAACLALYSTDNPALRKQALGQFLAEHPKSALRPKVLIEIAREEVVAGNRPKAKAYAEEAERLSTDQGMKDAARTLLEDMARADDTELEARAATRRAELGTQEAMARQKLAEQEAAARAEAARKEQGAQRAVREAAQKERQAKLQAERTAALERRKVSLLSKLHADAGTYLDVDYFHSDDRSGTYTSVRGKPNALFLHPISTDEAAYAELECYVPAAGATLVAEYCNAGQPGCDRTADFLASIVATDQDGRTTTLYREVVAFSRGWVTREISLNQFADQIIKLRFVGAAGGSENWCGEWNALGSFYVMK